MSDHYDGVLLEDIDSKIDAMAELVASLLTVEAGKGLMDEINKINSERAMLFKAVAEESKINRNQTKSITDHEIRITDLEDEDNLDYA